MRERRLRGRQEGCAVAATPRQPCLIAFGNGVVLDQVSSASMEQRTLDPLFRLSEMAATTGDHREVRPAPSLRDRIADPFGPLARFEQAPLGLVEVSRPQVTETSDEEAQLTIGRIAAGAPLASATFGVVKTLGGGDEPIR